MSIRLNVLWLQSVVITLRDIPKASVGESATPDSSPPKNIVCTFEASIDVSLNNIVADCNHKTYRRIDMGTVSVQLGVVDFGYVANSN